MIEVIDRRQVKNKTKKDHSEVIVEGCLLHGDISKSWKRQADKIPQFQKVFPDICLLGTKSSLITCMLLYKWYDACVCFSHHSCFLSSHWECVWA